MRPSAILDVHRETGRAMVSLVIIGEGASRTIDRHSDVVATHEGIPWTNRRGMRNRIACGYVTMDMGCVRANVQTDPAGLVEDLGMPR